MTAERSGDGPPEARTLGDLSAVGARIEVLLEASTSAGIMHRERAEELVGLLTDLYGGGIERILEILHERGQLDDSTLAAFAGDELVSSLLVVHGLHPYTVEQRVEDALERVRPYLGSHGGDVELLGVDDNGVVQLRLLGSCDGCPSSAVTLQLAVEGAIEAAAPEIAGIEVETPLPEPGASHSLISVDSLRSRLDTAPADIEWVTVDELSALGPRELMGMSVGGNRVFACRDGDDVFVYHDVCPACAGNFAKAALHASAAATAIGCPTCGREYDIRRAGAEIGAGRGHLDPLPALHRDAGWQVAVPIRVTA